MRTDFLEKLEGLEKIEKIFNRELIGMSGGKFQFETRP